MFARNQSTGVAPQNTLVVKVGDDDDDYCDGDDDGDDGGDDDDGDDDGGDGHQEAVSLQAMAEW